MEGLRAWPKPPGDAPVALRWLFAERHVTAQLPLGEPRGWLKNKRPWESGHTVYKPYLAEPLVLILGRAPSRDKRHPSYIDHPLRDLLAQRMYQIASGYADANDANHLRRDPLFKSSTWIV